MAQLLHCGYRCSSKRSGSGEGPRLSLDVWIAQVPGLNAPIPPGAEFGYAPGQWGKPPVDEQGIPLYGDVFGEALGEESEDEQARRSLRRPARSPTSIALPRPLLVDIVPPSRFCRPETWHACDSKNACTRMP